MDNIINLHTDIDTIEKTLTVEYKNKFCQHPQFTLDYERRMAHCSKCSQYFDSFDALIRISNNPQRIRNEFEELRRLVVKKRTEVEEVEKNLRSLKSKLKNARKKEQEIGVQKTTFNF